MNVRTWLVLCALCIGLAIRAPAQAQPAADAGTDQDNIIVVLDASGSMRDRMPNSNKTRMEAAKEALLAVLRGVPPTTNVGILVFSSSNLKNDWVYPLKPVDPAAITKAVNSPKPGGGTPLGAYLKKGTDALLKQRRAQHGFGTYRLLMVTDGKATDQALVDKYLPDVLSRGITIDVIGVDMAPDLSLATQVHSYRTADNAQSLVEAVKNVFAEVGGGGNDTGSEQDFALIAPIPDQMATAMLAALANVADHPIGETPPPPPTATTPGMPAAPPEQYDPFAPGLPPEPAASRGFFGTIVAVIGNLCFFGFIFLVIAAFALIQMGNAAQRRKRR